MKKYSLFYAIVSIFTLFIFTTEGNCFAGANDIKARMIDRKPTIDMLKSEGLLGENNTGYLEFIQGAAKKNESTVTAENKDRETVYRAIAQKEGTTEQFVGKRRATQIKDGAAPGIWLQKSSGDWYKK